MNPVWLASFAITLAGPPSLEPVQAIRLASVDAPASALAGDERTDDDSATTRRWDWPADRTPRVMRYEHRRAEGSVSGLPLFVYAIFSEFGLSPKHTSPDAAGLGPRDYVDGCSRRDPRCQAFHDDYGADYRETAYPGIAASVGGGAIGGVVRLSDVDREVAPKIEWDVHPQFVGLGGSF